MANAEKHWLFGESFLGVDSDQSGANKHWLFGEPLLPLAPVAILALTATAADSFILTDTNVINLGYELATADDLNNWLDALQHAYGLTATLSDTLDNWNDALLLGWGIQVAEDSAIPFLDAIATFATMSLEVSDTLAIADAIIVNIGYLKEVADAITFSDTFNLGYSIGTAVGDALSFSDSISARFNFLLNVSDALSFSDSVGMLFPYALSFEDAINFADAIATESGMFLAVSSSQAANWNDAVGAELLVQASKANLTNYIRRYLNDVMCTELEVSLIVASVTPVNNSTGGAWEVSKASIATYLRRYINDKV